MGGWGLVGGGGSYTQVITCCFSGSDGVCEGSNAALWKVSDSDISHNCVIFHYQVTQFGSHTGYLDDADCDSERNFVCKSPLVEQIQTVNGIPSACETLQFHT